MFDALCTVGTNGLSERESERKNVIEDSKTHSERKGGGRKINKEKWQYPRLSSPPAMAK
jgi:hypothetical protein